MRSRGSRNCHSTTYPAPVSACRTSDAAHYAPAPHQCSHRTTDTAGRCPVLQDPRPSWRLPSDTADRPDPAGEPDYRCQASGGRRSRALAVATSPTLTRASHNSPILRLDSAERVLPRRRAGSGCADVLRRPAMPPRGGRSGAAHPDCPVPSGVLGDAVTIGQGRGVLGADARQQPNCALKRCPGESARSRQRPGTADRHPARPPQSQRRPGGRGRGRHGSFGASLGRRASTPGPSANSAQSGRFTESPGHR
jgi:hypothetical protein